MGLVTLLRVAKAPSSSTLMLFCPRLRCSSSRVWRSARLGTALSWLLDSTRCFSLACGRELGLKLCRSEASTVLVTCQLANTFVDEYHAVAEYLLEL